MTDTIGMAILAAGEGKRLGKPIPKPLVEILGKSLVDYVFESANSFAQNNFNDVKTGMVVGHQKELVVEHFKSFAIDFPVQEKQLGTADALRSYFSGCPWAKDRNYTLVICGDTPLITENELELLWQTMKEHSLDGVAASFLTDNPFGYGRIISEKGPGFKIVEERDATENERLVNNVNSGLYLLKTSYLLEKLALISNDNKSGEFYLTDVFSEQENVGYCTFKDSVPFMGVNNLVQLNSARLFMQYRINMKHLQNGVHLLDEGSTWIDADVTIASGSTIYPQVHLRGKTSIGEGCVIDTGSILTNSHLGKSVSIKPYSILEGADVKNDCAVGPYARLRPGAFIGESSKIGNFVEIKKAELKKGVSVSHLSYIGDAEINDNVNIGCGFITCNYDGESKSKTIIGKNSFIGSDTQMIAPVEVGENCYIASGSTISKNLQDGDFAIARGRQENKKGMAKRFLKGKWSVK